jgi:hypothetical protein
MMINLVQSIVIIAFAICCSANKSWIVLESIPRSSIDMDNIALTAETLENQQTCMGLTIQMEEDSIVFPEELSITCFDEIKSSAVIDTFKPDLIYNTDSLRTEYKLLCDEVLETKSIGFDVIGLFTNDTRSSEDIEVKVYDYELIRGENSNLLFIRCKDEGLVVLTNKILRVEVNYD